MRPTATLTALLIGLLLAACSPEHDTRSHKMPKTNEEIEKQLAFTCAFEKDRIPERDPEAEMLFQHAAWKHKKNLLRQDKAAWPEIEQLYRIASAWGHDKAANNLADMMMRGQTSHDDRIDKPVDIAEDLIKRGIPHGYYMMGILLDNGYGVKQDEKAALQYKRKAADLGDPEAQYDVGNKLTQLTIRKPVPYQIGKDMKRCAADQGHAKAALEIAINLEGKQDYAEAVKYFQIAAKAGSSSGASRLEEGFNAPPPDDRLYYLGLDKDEERVARYHKIWDVLESYDYAGIKVPEIDEIVPLPPAPLPPWDGEIEWVKKWKKDEAPPLPSNERIAEMALAKGLNPETGLPVKVDLKGAQLLDIETGKKVDVSKETTLLLRKMRNAGQV